MATCEAELIERAAHGDQEAFRKLWEDHHAMAMVVALRLCHQQIGDARSLFLCVDANMDRNWLVLFLHSLYSFSSSLCTCLLAHLPTSSNDNRWTSSPSHERSRIPHEPGAPSVHDCVRWPFQTVEFCQWSLNFLYMREKSVRTPFRFIHTQERTLCG
jgi:hypothetical protein